MGVLIDKETAIRTRMEELEKDHSEELRDNDLLRLREVEQFCIGQLRTVREEMKVYEKCRELKSRDQGTRADTMMQLFHEDRAGVQQDKYIKKLNEQARVRVREEGELKQIELLTQMNKRLNSGGGRLQQPVPPPGQPPALPYIQQCGSPTHYNGGKGNGGKGGKGKGGKIGKNGGAADFGLTWIDGSYWDQSLAGVMGPSPSCFSGFYRALLDSADNGYFTTPGWPHNCASCGKQGHRHSECPASRWKDDQGVERVNVRWLWQNGMCDNKGARK